MGSAHPPALAMVPELPVDGVRAAIGAEDWDEAARLLDVHHGAIVWALAKVDLKVSETVTHQPARIPVTVVRGERPVVATVVPGSGGWLLDVSDRAPDSMPTPTCDRDPAQGGMGLQLVARLSLAHGWYVDEDRKHVWACLPTEADEPEPAIA